MLIDGNNLLCRAYYTPGYADLTHNGASDGLPTGAVFGFMKMLSNVLSSRQPSYLVVCFDTERRCWRNNIYPEYKANRNDTPEKLVPQKKYIRECLTAFNIHWIERQGFEADDIIASIVANVGTLGIFDDISVLTGDRDLLQLVSDIVTVLITTKGVSEIVDYTPLNIVELYGCPADQVPALKALAGDHSDNIPGIPSVGTKKAVKLLETYGSLEGILSNIDTIQGKLGDNMREHKDKILLYERITTLSKDCSLQLSIDLWELNLTLERGYALLSEFGIKKVRFI